MYMLIYIYIYTHMLKDVVGTDRSDSDCAQRHAMVVVGSGSTLS